MRDADFDMPDYRPPIFTVIACCSDADGQLASLPHTATARPRRCLRRTTGRRSLGDGRASVGAAAPR